MLSGIPPEEGTTALAAAVEQEIVSLAAGRIRFAHPLLSAAAYTATDAAGRRDLHAALAGEIERFAPRLVALAGFMRVLTPAFVARHRERLLNIHPSLLPAFPGLHTHERALAAGVKVHGCTVHFVTAELDHGPIVAQAAVPVRPGDDAAALAARVLTQEHVIYPRAVRWFLEGRLSLADGIVRVRGEDAQLVLAAE